MLVALGGPRTDVVELFSPDRFSSKSAKHWLSPGMAFDLRHGWDLAKEDVRRECWRLLEASSWVVIGSPPCTSFSILQQMNPDRGTEEFNKTMKQAIEHVDFCCAVFQWQCDQGRFFLFEQPASASSWKLKPVRDLMQRKGVIKV